MIYSLLQAERNHEEKFTSKFNKNLKVGTSIVHTAFHFHVTKSVKDSELR